MKKIKEILRKMGTAGLAAILLSSLVPVMTFAEELPVETDGDTATAERRTAP